MEFHSAGFAESPVLSRKTRSACVLYQGRANRCKED